MYNTDSHFFFACFSVFPILSNFIFSEQRIIKNVIFEKIAFFLHLLASVFALFDGDEVVAVASTPTPEETKIKNTEIFSPQPPHNKQNRKY